MLHVGELSKILAFLADQREKLVATDPLFAGVIKRDEPALIDNGGASTTTLSVQPSPSFDEEKKQLAARRERERRLRDKRARLEAEGVVNRTDEEIEALLESEMTGSTVNGSSILTNKSQIGNDKNPTMKVFNFSEMMKKTNPTAGGATVGGLRSSSAGSTSTSASPAAASSGKVFVKERVAAAGGKEGSTSTVVSGLAGLKSNNIAIKVFSNEGGLPLLVQVRKSCDSPRNSHDRFIRAAA